MLNRLFSSVVAKTAILVLSGSLIIGCASSKESAERDTMTANVGQYAAAPAHAEHPRVGVPPFKVTTSNGGGQDMNDLAADQMTTLLDQTGRFDVIERAQMQQLLNEQNLEGIVKSGELARAGQVRGVDYLLLGRVTDLRIKRKNKSTNFGLAQISGPVNLGGLDVKNDDIVITSECGVDIRLVNPSTGKIMVSNFSEFKRTDSAHAMGLAILGANAESGADIQLSEDDKGKILRMALDDSLRKSLPKIDAFLASAPARPAAAQAEAVPTPAAAAPVVATPDQAPPAAVPVVNSPAPAATPAAAHKFCPNCGKPVGAGDKFCPNCGAKIDDLK